MRYIVWLIGLLWSLPLYAQAVFNLDSLPVQGSVLSQGWRWQPGDNPAWATLAFDDRHWAAIDPTQDITSLPQIQQTHMGWLRLHLRVDSTLLGQVISMLIDQQVASQIYLNGRLIGGFGRVSTVPDQVEAYNPSAADQALWQAVHFQLSSQARQVLAIRFATQPAIRYVKFWNRPNPFLLVKLHQADQRNQNRVDSVGNFDITFLDYFKGGLLLILAFLHLFFYAWYPVQRVNLWFGTYCLFCSLGFLIQAITYQFIHSVPWRTEAALGQLVFFFGSHLLFLVAVYTIFDKRVGVLFYTALIGFSIYFVLFILQVEMPANLNFLLPLLLTDLEAVRLLLLAARKREKEYWILTLGAISFILFLIAYLIVPSLLNSLFIKSILVHAFFNISTLSPSISITLFLASRFAQTYRALADKLVQVETLSVRTLAQEQEKQVLLASQNETLERQVNARTAELSQSLTELKSTQSQLIQREKMASLGELTAGIAHEIQNPLNFVNNFSEVSTEVIDELTQGPIQTLTPAPKQEAQQLLDELKQNLTKIAHHGGRAAAIVRGMLEHARTSTGERRPTDLNALIGEYLTIAYQGYRATHPPFNCQILTELDNTIGPVSVVPQELGRVLLNLFNNALYALEHRKNTDPTDYQPTLRVQSRPLANGIQLRVEDNGCGIADAIRAKIFQPFFTTKPTGQGTGLGLSLSYDIITKGHGGELYVDNQPGQPTTFTLFLPTAMASVASSPGAEAVS